MTDSLKNALLGISSFNPPESLKSGARFTNANEYNALLDLALDNPEGFWMDMAQQIKWTTEPTSLGSCEEWFKDGSLDLRFCVENGHIEGLDNELLQSQINYMAAQIGQWNLNFKDAVLISVSDFHRVMVASFACLELGLTCVPISHDCDESLIAKRIKDTSCLGAIVSLPLANVDLLPKNRLILEGELGTSSKSATPCELDAMHPAFVLADSAMQTFTLPIAGFLSQAISAWRHLLDGRKDPDTLWIMTPPHHASSLAASLGALASGGRIGWMPVRPNLGEFATLLEQSKPRVLLANVKSILVLVDEIKADEKTPKLNGPELLIIEGETVEPNVWNFVREKMFVKPPHVVQVLSRPESGGFVAGPHPGATLVRPSSVGLPAPGMDLVVMDNHGNECETNFGGLLALRNVTPGMALELATLPTPIALEVKARKDKTGSLWTMGEEKVERTRKTKVGISELEAGIAEMKGVEQVAVVSFESEAGSKSKAFVKLEYNSEVTVEQIRQTVLDHHGIDAVPDDIQIVDSLPYSRTGKLLRSVLRRISCGQPIGLEDAGLITNPNVVAELTHRKDK